MRWQLWGVDRFPCSRATALDVFREGDFDYPYRLKQARAIHIII